MRRHVLTVHYGDNLLERAEFFAEEGEVRSMCRLLSLGSFPITLVAQIHTEEEVDASGLRSPKALPGGQQGAEMDEGPWVRQQGQIAPPVEIG